jgi:hypothetical protein
MSEREIQQMAGERRLEKLNNFSDEFEALVKKYVPEYDPIIVGQLMERVNIYECGAWDD